MPEEDRFTWAVGALEPGESAEIRFRAEAVASGEDVNRVLVFADQYEGAVGHEEATRIEP